MFRTSFKILGFTFLLIILSCSFKEPVLPSWLLPVNIPLSEETFNLGKEFAKDSTIIPQGPDSLLFISIEGDLDPSSLDDLYLEPQSDTGSIGLESIKLDSLQDLRTEFLSLRELLPGLSALIGNTVTIPDTTLLSITGSVKSAQYERIHVISGSVRLKFFNNLPFPIGPNSSNPIGLSLTLLNDTLNQDMIVDITIPDTIFTGEIGEGSDQIPQGGMWIYPKMRVDFDLPTSTPTQVFVTDSLLDSSGFWIEIDFENFEADEVIAELQRQVFSEVSRFSLEDENQLREGVIDRGAVHIDFQNEFNIDSRVVFTIPNIRTTQNLAFTDSIQITAGGSQTYEVAVDGFRVINYDNPNEIIDSVTVDFTVTTKHNSQFVHISNMDSIAFFIQTDSIYMQSFAGIFALDTLDVSEFSEDSIADYGDFNQGVYFQDAEISLNLLSELQIENLSLDLNVIGYHTDENGDTTATAPINISQTVTSNGSPGSPDEIPISISGPEVVNFLNILPTSLSGSGTIIIDGEAEIFQNSQILGSYLFSTPLRLEVIGLAPIEGVVTTFIENGDDKQYNGVTDTLDQEVRDLGEDLEGGELQLDIINHTPLQVSVRMLVSGDLSRSDSVFYELPLVDSLEFEKSGIVLAADVNPTTGFVNVPRTSTVTFELDKQEIQLFTSPPFKVGYEVKIFDSQGVIALRSIDFVKALGLAKIMVKVEDE